MALIAGTLLSKYERETAAKNFKMFDYQYNGGLRRENIEKYFKEYYDDVIIDTEIDTIFDAIDLDKNGFIEFSEFLVSGVSH